MRMRHDTHKRGFVNDLEAALNANGNQRIAQLQYSVLDADNAPLVIAIAHGSTDDRAPSENDRILVEEGGLKLAEPRLDMDLSCCNARSTSPFAPQHDISDHVFGAVETTRRNVEAAKEEETGEDEINHAGKRRLFAGLPVIERFVTPILSRILPLQRTLPYATNAVQVSLLA